MEQVSAEYWAVIPATGTGQRMRADKPKQYLPLGAKTILEQTLDNLLSYPKIKGAVLILNAEDRRWESLNYQHEKPLLLCDGGEQRHHSVFNGLQLLADRQIENCMVLIHDAVRPFVSHQDLDRLLLAMDNHEDGAILAAPVADTLKFADTSSSIVSTHPRDHLWRAFTPQAFRLELILSALESVIHEGLEITDDASAMEKAGYKPKLITSDSRNIKITHPQDLHLAELLLADQRVEF